MSVGLGRNGGGVLRLWRPGVLLHWCEGCGRGHLIDVHGLSQDGHVLGWDGDAQRPSIGERVRIEHEGAVCEYVLRAGVMYYLQSCTHALVGQSRQLREYPLGPDALPPTGGPPSA